MKLAGFSLSMAAVLACCTAAALADDAKPVRQLVYNFDITLRTDQTVHSSGIGGDGGASGTADYRAGSGDEGRITVDVVAVQQDNGLVVKISEQAKNRRNSVPTMCVTYGTGVVICDQSTGGVNEEEMSLLRFLGRNFVNRNMIDAKNHWEYSSNDPQSKETSNYTIDGTNGDLLNISYQRELKVSGGQPFTATTDGRISYNEKLSVPLSITEDTITRKSEGMGQDTRVEQQMAFKLASDSMQTASAH